MAKFSIDEVIEQAVQTEKLGFEFYKAMSLKFSENAKLKKLFNTLALKERVHEQRFAELREITKGETIENPGEVSAYLRAIVESKFFLGKHKSLPSLGRVKTVEDAVGFAMGFEKETMLYFYAIRDMVQEQDVVDEIINEEKSHIMWLARFRDSLAK